MSLKLFLLCSCITRLNKQHRCFSAEDLKKKVHLSGQPAPRQHRRLALCCLAQVSLSGLLLQLTVGGAAPLLLQRHHGANTGVHLPKPPAGFILQHFTHLNTDAKQRLTHMLREFDAFHCDIKGGGVFDAGALPPPLHHFRCLGLPLCPRWRAEELEAEFAADVQRTICADKLRGYRKKCFRSERQLRNRLVFMLEPSNVV